MKKRCLKKLKNAWQESFVSSQLKRKKMAMFCSAKEFIPTLLKSNVVYCLKCPCSNEKHIGKTDRNLVKQINEQRSCDDQHIYILTSFEMWTL